VIVQHHPAVALTLVSFLFYRIRGRPCFRILGRRLDRCLERYFGRAAASPRLSINDDNLSPDAVEPSVEAVTITHYHLPPLPSMGIVTTAPLGHDCTDDAEAAVPLLATSASPPPPPPLSPPPLPPPPPPSPKPSLQPAPSPLPTPPMDVETPEVRSPRRRRRAGSYPVMLTQPTAVSPDTAGVIWAPPPPPLLTAASTAATSTTATPAAAGTSICVAPPVFVQTPPSVASATANSLQVVPSPSSENAAAPVSPPPLHSELPTVDNLPAGTGAFFQASDAVTLAAIKGPPDPFEAVIPAAPAIFRIPLRHSVWLLALVMPPLACCVFLCAMQPWWVWLVGIGSVGAMGLLWWATRRHGGIAYALLDVCDTSSSWVGRGKGGRWREG